MDIAAENAQLNGVNSSKLKGTGATALPRKARGSPFNCRVFFVSASSMPSVALEQQDCSTFEFRSSWRVEQRLNWPAIKRKSVDDGHQHQEQW